MKPFLSVIIPAYNEAKNLPLTLIDVDKKLSEAEYSYEILVVNDGSSDQTSDIVNRFSHIVRNLKLIGGKENHGKGWAVREGMLAANGNYRLFTDAYNSISLDYFEKALPYFKDGANVVIGSRLKPGPRVAFQNFTARVLARLDIRDIRSGFGCFAEEAAIKIFDSARIDRWGFEAEILSLAHSLNYRIKEISVNWTPTPHSVLSLGQYFSMLWNIVRLRRRLKK